MSSVSLHLRRSSGTVRRAAERSEEEEVEEGEERLQEEKEDKNQVVGQNPPRAPPTEQHPEPGASGPPEGLHSGAAAPTQPGRGAKPSRPKVNLLHILQQAIGRASGRERV